MYFLCICKFCFIFKFTMYWTLICMYALFLNFHQCQNKRGKFFLFKNNVTFCGITSGFQKFIIFKFLIQKSQSIFKIAPFKWSVIITKVILSEKKPYYFEPECAHSCTNLSIYIYIHTTITIPVFMAVYGLGLYHKQTWHHLRTKIENIF